MGNNAIVGQSGGPTSVINASLAGVFQACVMRGANRVYGMRHGVQGLLKDDVVNLTDVLSAPGQLTLLRHTPASYLGSCRYKLPESDQMEAVYQEIFDVLRRYDIGYFFYIGGNADVPDRKCGHPDPEAAAGPQQCGNNANLYAPAGISGACCH